MKKGLILILVSCLFLTGCGKKELKYQVKSKDNYEFRVKVNGTIKDKSFKENYIIYKYNDKQIKVTKDDEDFYYVFDGKLYKDKYGKELLKEKYPTDFSYLYEIFNEKKKIKDNGDDLIGKKTFQFYSYVESKKNMNKIFETLGIDVKVKNNSKAVLYLDNGYIYNVFYRSNEENEEYKIDIEFYDFKNVEEIKQEFTDDLVEVEKQETSHTHTHTSKYEDRFNRIEDNNSSEERGKHNGKK